MFRIQDHAKDSWYIMGQPRNVFWIGSWLVSVIVNFNALLYTSCPIYRRIWKLTVLLKIKLQQEINILEKRSKCFQTFEMPRENSINNTMVILICKTDVYSFKTSQKLVKIRDFYKKQQT